MRFREWLLNESRGRPGAKQSLYPAPYGGIGQYAPCDWMPYAADAITYMPPEWLNYKFLYTFKAPVKANWAKGIKYISLPYKLPREQTNLGYES